MYTTISYGVAGQRSFDIRCGGTKEERKGLNRVEIYLHDKHITLDNTQLNELGNLFIALSEQKTDLDDIFELLHGYDIELTNPNVSHKEE